MQPTDIIAEDQLYVVVWKYEVLEIHRNQFRLAFDEGGEISVFLRSRRGFKGLRLFECGLPELHFLINIWKSEKAYTEFKSLNESEFDSLCKKYTYMFKNAENVPFERLIL